VSRPPSPSPTSPPRLPPHHPAPPAKPFRTAPVRAGNQRSSNHSPPHPSTALSRLPSASPAIQPILMAPPRTPTPRSGNTAGMRACSCPLCSGGAPGVYSWIPQSTWFVHQGVRSGRPPRSSRGAAAAAAPAAVAPSAAAPAPAAASAAQGPIAEDGGTGEGGGVGRAAAGAGGAHEVHPARAPEPHSLRPNGVCIPAQVFQDNIDDFVA